MKERWKPIPGYEGKYEVSDFGRVRSHQRRPRFLKPFVSKWWYEIVSLSDGGVGRKFQVHRLVALAFVEMRPGKEIVDHLDGNKRNNRFNNLEWCTVQENTQRAFDMGLCESCIAAATATAKNILSHFGKRKSQPVLAVNWQTGESMKFSSLKEAANSLGVGIGNISRVISGERKKAGGYKFAKILERGSNDGN